MNSVISNNQNETPMSGSNQMILEGDDANVDVAN